MKHFFFAGFLFFSVQNGYGQNEMRIDFSQQVKKFTSAFIKGQTTTGVKQVNVFGGTSEENKPVSVTKQLSIDIVAFRYAEEMAPVEVREDALLSLSAERKSSNSKFSNLQVCMCDIDFLIGSSRLYKMIVVLNF